MLLWVTSGCRKRGCEEGRKKYWLKKRRKKCVRLCAESLRYGGCRRVCVTRRKEEGNLYVKIREERKEGTQSCFASQPHLCIGE